jgi:hypothetical protein
MTTAIFRSSITVLPFLPEKYQRERFNDNKNDSHLQVFFNGVRHICFDRSVQML